MKDEKEKRFEEMKQIKDEVIALESSPLYKHRTENNYYPVIGEGSHFAKIMFVGEAPGKNEAKTGKPFCGAAGKILENLLSEANLKREEVYITNIVKDRPPENRDPLPEEIKAYGPFLDRQIEIIKPEIIATLGRYSMGYIFEKYKMFLDLEPISKAHGKVFEIEISDGKTSPTTRRVKIVPLYHPAAAIYNQHLIDTLKKDFSVLKSV